MAIISLDLFRHLCLLSITCGNCQLIATPS
uniref:SYMRK n=1 Tax=Arundo donax TaxID=35708 RepID=A0A0A9BVQ2_ARUDO